MRGGGRDAKGTGHRKPAGGAYAVSKCGHGTKKF